MLLMASSSDAPRDDSRLLSAVPAAGDGGAGGGGDDDDEGASCGVLARLLLLAGPNLTAFVVVVVVADVFFSALSPEVAPIDVDDDEDGEDDLLPRRPLLPLAFPPLPLLPGCSFFLLLLSGSSGADTDEAGLEGGTSAGLLFFALFFSLSFPPAPSTSSEAALDLRLLFLTRSV